MMKTKKHPDRRPAGATNHNSHLNRMGQPMNVHHLAKKLRPAWLESHCDMMKFKRGLTVAPEWAVRGLTND